MATGEMKLNLTQGPSDSMVPYAVQFSPDGNTLAAGTDDGRVRLWDSATGKLRVSFRGHTDAIGAAAFSPDGMTLATGGFDGTVKLWDVATGQERMTLTGHNGPIFSVAFAAGGTMLATGGEDGTVRLWRASSDEEATRRRLESDRDYPNTAAALTPVAPRAPDKSPSKRPPPR
jgi:WD40 repeat protein